MVANFASQARGFWASVVFLAAALIADITLRTPFVPFALQFTQSIHANLRRDAIRIISACFGTTTVLFAFFVWFAFRILRALEFAFAFFANEGRIAPGSAAWDANAPAGCALLSVLALRVARTTYRGDANPIVAPRCRAGAVAV